MPPATDREGIWTPVGGLYQVSETGLPAAPLTTIEAAFLNPHSTQKAAALVEKMAYNTTRADHKRENRLKEGGKRF